MSGSLCGQTGPNLSATFTPDHSAPVTGGINRRLPRGGLAYGIPRNTSTGSKCLESRVTMTPLTSPYFVRTVLEVSCCCCCWGTVRTWSGSPREIARSAHQSITKEVERMAMIWFSTWSGGVTMGPRWGEVEVRLNDSVLCSKVSTEG